MGTLREKALELSRGQVATPKNIERVAASTSEESARWAFSQWELRKRARAKFERADNMLFDRDGLEMASHGLLARFNATRFPIEAKVADLTCGIGGDLIALAEENVCVGFEIDPGRCAMARHNLAVHGRQAEVRNEDCLERKWDFEYAFADPTRRLGGRRTLDPENFSPPIPVLVERMKTLALGFIKLSPMLSDSVLMSIGSRIEFVSLEGECREALVYVGQELEYPDGTRDSSTWAVQSDSGRWLLGEGPAPASLEAPLGFLFEADPAAIRAHALGDLCGRGEFCPLGESNGYLTSERLPEDWAVAVWVRSFRTITNGAADEKRIRSDLKRLDAHIDAVKVRGAREDPREWQRKLKTEGKRPLVLALYPVGRSLRYVLIEPLGSGK